MLFRPRPLILGILLLAVLCHVAWAASPQTRPWKPVPGNLLTQWSEKVDPKLPWPEHPRPQMERAHWINLNGLWEYTVTEKDAKAPTAFTGQILVPFPIESALSGVKRPFTPKDRLWYRRTFKAPELAAGRRLLLHFEAVDWETQVWVNGQSMGQHRGGYDRFSFDVGSLVRPGKDNELLVAVTDETGGIQSRGKQLLSAIAKPGGIMYTPTSGIWQTVWLEVVPSAYVESLTITPQLETSQVIVRAAVRGRTSEPVRVLAMEGGRTIASTEGQPDKDLVLTIPNAKPWTPDTPFLYDLRVSLGDDTLKSYFGMRRIALGKDKQGVLRPMLNGKFVFQSGPLDQGFWPDGIYTAPTDEALRYDIEATKRLGFNMTRKHVKIEPARWYYWCDKLGLLVWQDMPSAGAGRGATKDKDGVPVSPEAAAQFEAELKAMVDQHFNHPSIIMWVVFNEGWGQYDTPRLTRWVKQLDPSRLVDNASGWHDRKVGDVIDMHAYPGPNSPAPEETRAAVLGEFGGLGLGLEGHKWVDKSWGYRGVNDQAELTRKYLGLWKRVRELCGQPGLSAAVYTQITDVETECNGLLTYDRAVFKVDVTAAYDALVRGKFPPAPEFRPVVPTAEREPTRWRYTLSRPNGEWFQPGFDDRGWSEGMSGFGTKGTPAAVIGTIWKGPDIWLRREFNLPQAKTGQLLLRVHHDEDAEIYLNGLLAAKLRNYTVDYEEVSLPPAVLKTLRPGKNTIAIHCHQTRGGQYIDAGLAELVPPKK